MKALALLMEDLDCIDLDKQNWQHPQDGDIERVDISRQFNIN